MIRFRKDILQNFVSASSREWLETNGIGGFASSTVIGLNTRRYHGLLTAAMQPPAGRVLLLSKCEETLIVGERRYELSTNAYPGAIHPQGYRYLEGFRLDPFPTFTFSCDGIELEKSVFMVHGANSTIIQYRLTIEGSEQPIRLELRPFIAFRDYHSLTHENGGINRHVNIHSDKLISLKPYPDLPALYWAYEGGHLDTRGDWYRNFEYAIERERGLDFVEDLFNPFTLSFYLKANDVRSICASTEPVDIGSAHALSIAEIRRRNEIMKTCVSKDELVRSLTIAADHYIVNRGSQKTIIAGYHWFTDWGRDTMISLPGLTLVTGRYDIARSILMEFARHVDQGMLPNRFPDFGELPEYNTIDATLWYFEAVRSFLQYTGDYEFVRSHLLPILVDIVEWHLRGTRYGIHMDGDGLITSNDANVQLTWMDARVGNWIVTPRNGKAVEIQALWYNALRTMEDIATKLELAEEAHKYSSTADCTRRSFNELFWNEPEGSLYDTVAGGERDASIRPNQIFAVSLHHSMLDVPRAKRVVDTVESHLFTPYGLRTLSPADPRYQGRYEGDPAARDSAYHQGPAWGWLIGPFITAYLKVNGNKAASRRVVRGWLSTISAHLNDVCVGHISELFDGEPPHHPRGCVAQAWSAAEILRAATEFMQSGERRREAAAV